MSLIECSECKKEVSDKAQDCPGCGNPIAGTVVETSQHEEKVDKQGAWCPNCGSRNSYKGSSGGGCLLLGILFISLIGILLIPFLPKEWKCKECGHSWKA